MARSWWGKDPKPEPEKPKGFLESLFGKKETPPNADKSGGVGLSEGSALDSQGRPKQATHQAYLVNARGVHHSHVSCWCNSKTDHEK